MTEYIVKCNEFVGISGKVLQLPDYIDQSKEIIRCRDCKHYRDVRMADGTTSHRCSGVMAFVDNSPDGFCAWAEHTTEV